MSFSLINNLSSQNSQQKLSGSTAQLNQTLQRLSSGLRINKSGDDAAGLSIANNFRNDISVLSQGVRNANDGVSTLQIIDGGLSTVSNLLDRASTLAAQSASGTFVGSRDTLQQELGKVLTELDRQTQNVGLGGASGTDAGRFNRSINVFIGGGTDASAANNQVNVDLSSSRVDSVGLSLTNLNIGNGTGSVTGNQSLAAGLTAAETLTFTSVGASGNLTTFTVALSAAASSSNVADTINNDANIKNAGITASIDSSNKLVLKSAEFFAVSSSLADGANQTGIGGAAAAANDTAISSAAHKVTKAVTNAAAISSQTFEFSGAEIGFTGTAKTVSFATSAVAATGAAAAAASVNNDTTLRAAGVFSIVDKANGSQVSVVSLKNFNLGITTAAVAANNNIAGTQTTTAAGAATLTGGEQGGKDALIAIKAALTTLGAVQGKVGAGQNSLSQAISLASAQITNFQAAESAIRDADITAEASNLSRLTTLQQAGIAALAQANQSSQAVLSLLR